MFLRNVRDFDTGLDRRICAMQDWQCLGSRADVLRETFMGLMLLSITLYMHRLLWQETFTGLRLLGITLYMHHLLWKETPLRSDC
jgi:hypothetical protein